MVYRKLEEEILSGELTKDSSLAEIALSKRLGVSRTPVRGALHRLAEEGLVELVPNKGAVVLGINADDLINIYHIRMRLEGLASYLAAERITEENLKKLKEAVELTEFYINKNDTEHLKELDTEFHSIIFDASGNRLLSKTLSELHRKIKRYRKRSLSVEGRLESSIAEHKQILAAIESKNASLADELTSVHIKRALDNMLIALELDSEIKDGIYGSTKNN